MSLRGGNVMGIVPKKSKKLEDQIKYQFIARPDAAKELMVYKWPDHHIRYYSVVTVQPDELAFFVNRGEIAGYVEPGEHRLDGPGVPLVQDRVDEVTGGKVLIAELYFVSTREFANRAFMGSMGEVRDPETDSMVGVRVRGEYAMKAVDPGKLILNLQGTRPSLSNAEIQDVVSDHVLMTLRALVNANITEHGWDVLKITSGAYNLALEEAVLPVVAERLADYGLAVTRIEDFDVSVDPADSPRLQEIYDRRAKTKLAGDSRYGAMAEAEAILGAAEGLRSGGGGGGGGGLGSATDFAGVGIGLGIGMKVAERFMDGDRATGTAPGATVTCGACGAKVAPGKFCGDCGALLTDPAGE